MVAVGSAFILCKLVCDRSSLNTLQSLKALIVA